MKAIIKSQLFKTLLYIIFLMVPSLISATEANSQTLKQATEHDSKHESKQKPSEYDEIIWEQLIPEDDLEILLNPPESIWDIEDGSMDDTLESIVEPKSKNDKKTRTDSAQELRYKAALRSFNVVKSFDNKTIRLPGFIVPLVTNEQNKVTEFFIVPYFGACLHMPPPPPNQIVFATLNEGHELTSLRQAFWFEGKISIFTHNNNLGDSAYKLEVHTIAEFDPFAEFAGQQQEKERKDVKYYNEQP